MTLRSRQPEKVLPGILTILSSTDKLLSFWAKTKFIKSTLAKSSSRNVAIKFKILPGLQFPRISNPSFTEQYSPKWKSVDVIIRCTSCTCVHTVYTEHVSDNNFIHTFLVNQLQIVNSITSFLLNL